MKKVILEAKKLNKSFSNEGIQNHVINGMDLKIYEGDFTVVMGPSGSGKSTLLYNISGMEKPTSGTVLYKEQDITSLNEKQMAKLRVDEFGFVFQQVHLVSSLTVLENILVAGYMGKNAAATAVREDAMKLLADMNVEEIANRFPAQVSGGEAQRGAIARAVINHPGILFADEPTGALNRKNTKDVLNLFSELNEKGQTILMVTHDMKAAIRANRIIYIEDGQVCGELALPPYEEADKKSRENQVNAWLDSLSW
ncbi:MAG: ABC transporter ATP-binding protein [Eubacteriales bacterium]|nr:ABC transporter ATP-binding protein [Eubacteriales bacterium]